VDPAPVGVRVDRPPYPDAPHHDPRHGRTAAAGLTGPNSSTASSPDPDGGRENLAAAQQGPRPTSRTSTSAGATPTPASPPTPPARSGARARAGGRAHCARPDRPRATAAGARRGAARTGPARSPPASAYRGRRTSSSPPHRSWSWLASLPVISGADGLHGPHEVLIAAAEAVEAARVGGLPPREQLVALAVDELARMFARWRNALRKRGFDASDEHGWAWEQASEKRRQLTWSTGRRDLRSLANLGREASDEEVAEEELDAEVRLVLARQAWANAGPGTAD